MYTDPQIERNTDPGDDAGGSRSSVWAMNVENRLLVTDEPIEIEFKFKTTSGNLPIISEEYT